MGGLVWLGDRQHCGGHVDCVINYLGAKALHGHVVMVDALNLTDEMIGWWVDLILETGCLSLSHVIAEWIPYGFRLLVGQTDFVIFYFFPMTSNATSRIHNYTLIGSWLLWRCDLWMWIYNKSCWHYGINMPNWHVYIRFHGTCPAW